MNKKVIFMPLLVAAAGILAACSTSTIVARPSWIDQKIIDNVDTKDNQMKVIYDAVKALGDTNANVLNKILYEISVKNIGYYDNSENGLLQFKGKTLNDEVKDKLKTFVNNHTIYKTKEKKLIEKNGNEYKETTISDGDDNFLQVSLNMIQSRINEIEENIYEKLYDDIKGGTYSVDNIFYEEKFVMSLRENLYDTPSLKEIAGAGITLKSGRQLLPRGRTQDKTSKEWSKESWGNYIKKYLSIDEKVGEKTIYGDYISRKIIPDLYRTYLIQTYVGEQRYSNISRSYARKVNMITIAKGDTELKGKIGDLMASFAKHYIIDNEQGTGGYNFEVLETAMRGLVGTSCTPDDYSSYDLIANKAGFTAMEDDTSNKNPLIWTSRLDGKKHKVFEGTKLADLVKKYQQIYDITMTGDNKDTMSIIEKANPDQTAYNDLTNSGAYTVEEGLKIKEREILNTTYTKDGWYLKDGGLSDLNSEIRERVFNIQTSNLIDSRKSGDYDKDKNPNGYRSGDYVRYFNVNGVERAFLTEKKPASAKTENLVILDDGTNYHIIEIEEAISTSKMSDSDNKKSSYMWTRATSDKFASINAINKIAFDVIKAASSADTYKKNANQYYLMLSNILFYDQSVYDYFKSQYPDLFK